MKSKVYSNYKIIKAALVVCICFLFIGMLNLQQVSAAKKNGWYEKNNKTYYYNESGEKETGKTTIKNKTYFFDSKGVMVTGWRKIKDNYYFFHNTKGHMIKGKKINNVKLKKTGEAKVTKYNKEHLKTLIRAGKIYSSVTKPSMSKAEKLKACFKFVKKYPYGTRRIWKYHRGWEVDYANDMFVYGRGNCYSYAAAFAYLANACGYRNVYIISSGGHGWCEINGYVYDPEEHNGKQGNMYRRSYASLWKGYRISRRVYYRRLS